jgi:hypothetical protein
MVIRQQHIFVSEVVTGRARRLRNRLAHFRCFPRVLMR